MSGVRLLQHERQSNTHLVVDFPETGREFSVLVLNRNAEGLSHGKIQFIFHVIAHLCRNAVEGDGFAGRADGNECLQIFRRPPVFERCN